MPDVSEILKEFVSGELDFAGLERALGGRMATGDTREGALDALEQITLTEDLSPAVAGLLRRAIDRHFAMDDTDPFPKIQPTRPRQPLPDMDTDEETDPDLPLIYPKESREPEPEPETPESGTDEVPASPEPGDVIAGRYEIEGLIGRGGAGLVYRAVDHCRLEAGSEDPRIALKVLKPELAQLEEAQRRLLSEGVRGAELRHENLVRVIDVGHDEGLCFLTMELLEGDTLRNAILRHSSDGFEGEEALRILAGIALGLAFLHGRGLVHGDLKPGNIFLTSEGQPKLLDFGTAAPGRHGREPTLSAAAPPGRTPAYASPEALGGDQLKFSDDIFSLGCVACELFSSKHPFDRVQADEARERRIRASLPRSISGTRRQALAAALQFDGTRRPPDAAAFIKAMGLGEKGTNRAGLALAALGGLAAGILLVLAIISPAGPLARFVHPETGDSVEAPPSPEATRESVRTTGDYRPPATDVDEAGSFVPPASSPSEPDPARESRGGSLPDGGTESDTDRAAAAPEVDEIPGDDQIPTTPGPRVTTPEPETAPALPPGPGSIVFAQDEYRVTEGTAVVIATIARRNGLSGDVSVRWRTVPGSAETDADFAGSDWEEVTIAEGQEGIRIYVPLVDDGLLEDEESFFLELAEPGGGAVLGSPARVRVRISDDEA